MTIASPPPRTRISPGDPCRQDEQSRRPKEEEQTPSAHRADIPLDRDRFMRSLIRELAGTLEDVVGVEDASGYISVVGGTMGAAINAEYRKALQVDRLTREQVADVLVDLKRRINGDFYVIEESETHIILGNRACPFGDKVLGRPSMCMMTSNVFGHVAADNLGYAKVELARTIAEGHSECRVIVHLTPDERVEGREYFRSAP
jgi:predicted ArsR family transcriptional regulator